MIVSVAGVRVALAGIAGPLRARAARRYRRFLVEGPADLTIAVRAGRDVEHRPDGDPSVTRDGGAFIVEYGAMTARLDPLAGGEASLPPSVYAVDSLLRITLGLALVERGGLLLHGSGVLLGESAIVCFGPSGVGKTTVARSVPPETVLCDEMIALVPDGEQMVAHGTPFHGDYHVCAPLSAPLRALVRLRQGDVDHLEQLSPAVGVQALLGSTLFFCKDPEISERLLSLAIRICQGRTYRLTFERGTHAPTFIDAALAAESAPPAARARG
jgi:hypothetical protein